MGSTHELSGVTPRTMIWSIRTIGNVVGQVKPKPSPATSWAERIREVMPSNARSSMVPFRSPSRTTRSFRSAERTLPSARAFLSRVSVQKPTRGFTRADPIWATYTASGPRSVATVVRSALA